MAEETGRCEISFESTAVFELAHRFTRRLADGHTSGMGQLSRQPQMMEMLVRASTVVSMAQVEFPALFKNLVKKAQKRAKKYRPERRASRSCLKAAVAASKHCCDVGKAAVITNTADGCTIELTEEPCPAKQMCTWRTGATACSRYDESSYPPDRSPWCSTDARRKGGPREPAPSSNNAAQEQQAAEATLEAALEAQRFGVETIDREL